MGAQHGGRFSGSYCGSYRRPAGAAGADHFRAIEREHQHSQPGGTHGARPFGPGARRDDGGRARQEATGEAGLGDAAYLWNTRRRAAAQLNMVSTDPEHIAISKSKGITIDWKDGHQQLRAELPARAMP